MTPKSGPKSGSLREQKHGGALKSGGSHARPGRPRNEFLDWCRRTIGRAESRAQVEAVLKNSKHPAYAAMWKAVAERAHGKPEQPIAASGEVTVRVVRG